MFLFYSFNLYCFTFLYILAVNVNRVYSHGRLVDPPSRSSAWRYGFDTVKNYNDHQLYCGGKGYQREQGGKCGICGDPYGGPLDNELPDGMYAKNLVITRKYSAGQTITAKAELTANHAGYFQFKLCPATTMDKEVTQECLDSHTLQVQGSGDRFPVPSERPKTYEVAVQLPSGLTCERCVFQWTYTAGNDWGQCPDGTSAVGCGPQETFRGCADISIN